MLSILLTVMLSLPLYPLNPTNQDTISTTNIHLTFGMNGPTSFLSGGPEFSAKYEYRIYHPFIIRSSFEYRYGSITSNLFPDGDIYRYIISAEGMYYRGTDDLTGYFGGGVIFSTYNYSATDAAIELYDDLYGADEIRVKPTFGYRITAGLRFYRHFSLELGITEIRPTMIFYKAIDQNRFQETTEKFRFNDFKVSFGYLFSI